MGRSFNRRVAQLEGVEKIALGEFSPENFHRWSARARASATCAAVPAIRWIWSWAERAEYTQPTAGRGSVPSTGNTTISETMAREARALATAAAVRPFFVCPRYFVADGIPLSMLAAETKPP